MAIRTVPISKTVIHSAVGKDCSSKVVSERVCVSMCVCVSTHMHFMLNLIAGGKNCWYLKSGFRKEKKKRDKTV